MTVFLTHFLFSLPPPLIGGTAVNHFPYIVRQDC